jgi:copper transporter 1
MFNGFQSTINGACVKLLFQPWVLDSAGKYVVGLIGCFFLSALSEFLNKLRPTAHQQLLSKHEHRVRGKLHLLRCKAPLAVLYVAHMATAFLAMLVVMTYETGLFLALLFGFIAGFVLFRSFDKDVTDEPGVWRFVDPSTTALRISGMSCEKSCGAKVEAALRAVPGVSNAFVQFDTKTAYVAGPAALDDLADAISAAGYGFQHELK